MCGILYRSSFYKKPDVNSFLDAHRLLRRRGPDDSGVLLLKHHLLGHRRLSIINPRELIQPMSILNHHLIYNGEIYNTPELNKELGIEAIGDTYTLLRLLMRDLVEGLNKINGIFAFCYLHNDEVIAVRDQFGVKPLFYTQDIDGDIAISSEIKCLLKLKGEVVVDKDGLCELLAMGPSHSFGKTIYKGIYEVPPGHYLRFSKQEGLRIVKYYELPVFKYQKSYNECVRDVRLLLDDAIKRQMISDVDVSAFLSGGLDSSIISTIISKNKEKLDTYTITYEGNEEEFKPNDFEISTDTEYARLVSNSIGSNFHLVDIDNDTLIKGLYTAVVAKDMPGMTDIDSSMLGLACKISKSHKVSLSGECADELFGGYRWYYDSDKEYTTFPWIRGLDLRESLLNEKYRGKLKLKEYVRNEFDRAKRSAVIDPTDTKLNNDNRVKMYMNIYYFMQNLLDRKDRMTMYESLEVRVPFCDKRLVELLYNVPFKYKYKSKIEKKLLRDAYSDVLDERIVNRKKSPYPKSITSVYSDTLRKLITAELDDETSILNELFDKERLLEFINSRDLDVPWYGQLMRRDSYMAYLIQIAYWYKLYNVRIDFNE